MKEYVKKFSSLAVVVALAFAVLFAVGCSSKEGSTVAEQEPKKGLLLAIGSESEDGFDPTAGWGRYGSPLFQSTLLTRDSDLNIITTWLPVMR